MWLFFVFFYKAIKQKKIIFYSSFYLFLTKHNIRVHNRHYPLLSRCEGHFRIIPMKKMFLFYTNFVSNKNITTKFI